MQVVYKNTRIEKTCTDAEAATKIYGIEMAEKIQLRIDQLYAASCVEELIQFKIGRCHPLKGNRNGQYAMDLVHPHRLVFEKKDEQIVAVRILEIIDYH